MNTAWTLLCRLEELREGQMSAFEVGGREVIVLWPEAGEPKGYDGQCPHQQLPLADGEFDGKILECAAHFWMFDAYTGEGVNPEGCRLTSYLLRIDGDDVFVELTD